MTLIRLEIHQKYARRLVLDSYSFILFIITFTSLALDVEGVHKGLTLYEVLTRSQGKPIDMPESVKRNLTLSLSTLLSTLLEMVFYWRSYTVIFRVMSGDCYIRIT